MRIFGDDKYSGRKRDKYGSRDRRDRSDRPQMYDAVCDKCGRDCKVPFRPSNDKPIYCSECFEEMGNGDSDRRRSGGRRDSYRNDRRRSDRKEMFTAICDDCGKECEVPFKPSSDKPIYCSECFEKRGGNDKGGGNNRQLEEINEKLDRILEILGKKMEDVEENDDDNDEKEIDDTEEEKAEEIKED